MFQLLYPHALQLFMHTEQLDLVASSAFFGLREGGAALRYWRDPSNELYPQSIEHSLNWCKQTLYTISSNM